MDKPIVVGTDGSPSADRAVEWAAAEAARRGRRLHIVYAVRPRDCGFAYHPEAWEGEAGEQILGAAAALATKTVPDLTVTSETAYETPVFALRERSGRAAEVVVGHRGRGGFAGLLLGSTSLSLAGRTPCPLIVVRGDADDERAEILAGVDLTDESSRVLEYAFETAALRGGWVRVVHSWEVPATLFNGGYPVIVREALARAQDRLSELVAPWRARYPDLRVVEETPPGHPVERLVERTERSDLVVVGSHRHGSHIGSVSHGVIHHADCPVAVIDTSAK